MQFFKLSSIILLAIMLAAGLSLLLSRCARADGGFAPGEDVEEAQAQRPAPAWPSALNEPRGCPTPGACSCVDSEAAIRADERRKALETAIWSADRCTDRYSEDPGFVRGCEDMRARIVGSLQDLLEDGDDSFEPGVEQTGG